MPDSGTGLLAWMIDGKARPGMKVKGAGEPIVDQSGAALGRAAIALAATAQCPPPQPPHKKTERCQAWAIGRHGVVLEIPAHHFPQGGRVVLQETLRSVIATGDRRVFTNEDVAMDELPPVSTASEKSAISM